ncbi:hypothetical protein GGX14DRAFT_589290 [Mycena pura]|uniref:F-box domain-containing protein n=1 Tax=Mycena pura TaxID=153505 RepID=A0AAD6UW44_9AGAR|nr:hypothetical protein GGX14DRAFT_589290 [Mycena pura]
MHRPPAIAILKESPEAAQKILEAILDSPNGRRGLSRLARTCRAWLEPALDVLWRELDSLAPLIGLFPPHLLKKTKKPGLGLSANPVEKDWERLLKYGNRVLKITYDEMSNNVSTSIFPIFEDFRPKTYLLPNLQHLTWKVTTPETLDRASLFLNSGLQGLVLHLGTGGTKFPTLTFFLADLGSRLKLKSFSITSSTSMPETFTELLLPQDGIEKLVVIVPGALSSSVGKWIAYMPRLKSLQLDLTSRSLAAINGFFKELLSGDSTPDSVESHTDSGVFSGDEVDFTEIRKSLLDLTGDTKTRRSKFPVLTQLHLTGQASNIATFLTHMSSPLTQLDIVIEDPPDAADWRRLSSIICERFGSSLVTLRVGATLSSKYGDLVRSTSRAAPAPSRLSLEHLSSLPQLRTLSIDLPESICFTASDIEHLAEVAPNLEEVRLCPLARFAQAAPPQLTLEGLAPLIRSCRRLTTMAVVVNAKGGSAEVSGSSNSLLWLHVGHSWVMDTFQVAILLSQFAPHLETIKWFTERNRPGFVEANARGWQKVSDILPHLQNLRLTERRGAPQLPSAAPPPPPEKEVVIEYVEVVAPRPPVAEKAIDATVRTVDCGVEAKPPTMERSAQATPSMSERGTQVNPSYASIGINATPQMMEAAVDATTKLVEVVRSSVAVQTTVEESAAKKSPNRPSQMNCGGSTNFGSLLSVFSLIDFMRVVVLYPLGLPMRILSATLGLFKRKTNDEVGEEREVALDTFNVRP